MSESIHEPIEPMRSEMLIKRDSVEHLDMLLKEVMGESLSRGMSANQRAMVAWYGSNGDRERAHTRRVFLRKPKVQGADPIICVYVDSHSYLTDLTANKDIYLARLANWGFQVSGIEFGVDREMRRGRKDDEGTQEERHVIAEPSEEVLEEVDHLVKDIPESLRQQVSRAIIASKSARPEK